MSEKIKVSELNASSTTTNDDLVMIVQENSNNELENFKQTRQNFLNGIATEDEVKELSNQVETLEDDLYGNITTSTSTGEKIINGTKENRDLAVPKIYGNSTQESTNGYNLVNYDNTEVTLVKSTNRTITITPSNFPITLQAGTYTISCSDLNLSNSNYGLGVNVLFQPSGDTQIGFITTNTGKITFTINEETSYRGLYFYMHNSDNDNATATFSKIMLESGSTAHEWEQYTGGIPAPNPSYPFPIKSVTGNNNVVVRTENLFTGLEKGKKVNPTTGALEDKRDSAISDYISVDFSTNTSYTISGLTDTLNSLVAAYNSNKQFLGRTSGIYRTSVTLDTSSFFGGTPQGTGDIAYIIVNQYWVSGNTGTIDDVDNLQIMLNTGDTAKPYQPYGNQTKPLNLGSIELNKIGTYQDYIYKNGDKWYKHEEIKRVSLNTTNQNWTKIATASPSKYRYRATEYSDTILKPATTSDIASILCTNYIPQKVTIGGSYSGYQGIAEDTSGYIFINDDNYLDNLDGWKTWLDTANVSLLFALATPTDIEITDTTLIGQLEAIQKLKQYEGTTVVTIDDIKQFDILMDGSKIEKIEDDVSTLQTNVGNLTNLTTTVKTDLVAAVNEVNGAIGDIGSLLDELNGTEV